MNCGDAGKLVALVRRRRSTATLVCALLCAATLAGNWQGLRSFVQHSVRMAGDWKGRGYRGNGEHTDAFRELAAEFVPTGEALYYCQNSADGRLQPGQRSTHLALSWALSPEPVRFGNGNDIGEAAAIIVSKFSRMEFPGYWRVAENKAAALWLREEFDAGLQPECPPPPAPWREAMGVAGVCALVVWLVWLMRPKNTHIPTNRDIAAGASPPHLRPPILTPRVILIVCVAAFFVLAATAVLTHTFFAPTGLGVYGGKARLFYLVGGIPSGFFCDPAFSSYQPAYPPGLTMLTLLAYGIAGGCGEWLMQLLPVCATAAVLWLMVSISVGSRWAVLWILATFLNKQTLQMATYYYAEPCVALLVLLGWLRLRLNRNDLCGWMLLGATGLFKTEGLILLCAAWAAFGLEAMRTARGRRRTADCRLYVSLVARLVVAAIAPLAWHVACRMVGATFYDYAPVWAPDWAKFATALGYLLKTAFLEPWRYGFAYPLAVAALAAHLLRRGASAKGERQPATEFATAFAALFCLVAFAYVYALSRAPGFDWHLWSSAARLLWVPALPVLVGFPDSKTRLAAHGTSNEKKSFFTFFPLALRGGIGYNSHCPD